MASVRASGRGPRGRLTRVKGSATLRRTARVGVALVLTMLMVGAGLVVDRGAAQTARGAVLGGSRTLLSDGRWLLVGGEDEGRPTATLRIVEPTGDVSLLASRLRYPRAWHSATMLADGRILILGGFGTAGSVVGDAEILDLGGGATLIPAGTVGVEPRALHTATLLPDGRVLIAGGISSSGAAVTRVEVWDPQSLQTARFADAVPGRYGATATLLPDGTVFIAGGLDERGDDLTGGVLCDPRTGDVSAVDEPPWDLAPRVVQLTKSAPPDGAAGVSADTTIVLQFSGALPAEELAGLMPSLWGSDGEVNAQVVPAEDGRLVFIVPDAALQPGDMYRVTIPSSSVGNSPVVDGSVVTFRTAGKTGRETTSASVPPPGDDDADVEPARPDRPSDDRDDRDEFWVPNGQDWTTGRPPSRWASLPALQAPPGVTALAGQLLRLNGKPLKKAVVRIGNLAATTDRMGRFLLTSVPSGHAELFVDGRPANTPRRTYGLFEIGVDLHAGETTVLPYVIWMPVLDTAHAVTISSPAVADIVVRSPYMPDLEVHIPRGTVLYDHEQHPVGEVSLTPVPLDRPPFPMPAKVDVPIYFTLQPGGAYVTYSWSGGVRIIYPNYKHYWPGRRANFWHYDPAEKGWYVYGRGRVTDDERQIVPDPGVSVYEFTGAMAVPIMGPATGPVGCGDGNAPGCGESGGGAYDGEPVNLATGLFVHTATDLYIDDVIPLAIQRTYRQGDAESREFGVGTSLGSAMYLEAIEPTSWDRIDLFLPDSSRLIYRRTDPGTEFELAVLEHHAPSVGCPTCVGSPGPYNYSILQRDNDRWKLTQRDGTIIYFDNYSRLQSIQDRFGNQLTVSRESPFEPITHITSPSGRWVVFEHDTADRITAIHDNIGRTVGYGYDQYGRLTTVTDAMGGVTTYTYDDTDPQDTDRRTRMLKIRQPQQNVECSDPCLERPFLENKYYVGGPKDGMVEKQTLADGATYDFDYALDGNGKVMEATVLDPVSSLRRVTFNADGYVVSDTKAEGTSAAQAIDYGRQGGTNLVTSVTDALVLPGGARRKTTYDYNAAGMVTRVTRLADTATPSVTEYEYEPRYQQVTLVRDPLGHDTTLQYGPEPLVVLQSITDATDRRIDITLNAAGQLATVNEPVLASDPDPVQHTTTFTYERGALATIQDPLGNTTRRTVDGVGRVRSVQDPRGNVVLYAHDARDRVISITDALDGVIGFDYDRNDNLRKVLDQRHNPTAVTEYMYDRRNLLRERKDPLNHSEFFDYSSMAELSKHTDRRGIITDRNYDERQRLRCVGFGRTGGAPDCTIAGNYESTIGYGWDDADRLMSATDSLTGAISRNYDGLDNISLETSSLGSVTYTHDSASRRETMTVAGQSTIGYCYDNADRVTTILDGTDCVASEKLTQFAYDDAGRQHVVTLPNGTTAVYSYDPASRVSSIEYKKADESVIGGLSYQYDAAANRTGVVGSWARSGLPAALGSASYDPADRILTWDGVDYDYDLNGNLTDDGSNTYTWSKRNVLTGTSGTVPAVFEYDALGRRKTRAINWTVTQFIYDGFNPVQERSPTSGPVANLLTGLGIDEYLSRTLVSGAERRSFMYDALGSTLALTDDAGAVRTDYRYEPFGTISVSGEVDTNPVTFTGREIDGTSLYYYRARYFAPYTGRFISEDPVAYPRHSNFYIYAGNSPVVYSDPEGRDYWIEGPVPSESGWGAHQSICVGTRGGSRSCISFGRMHGEAGCLLDCKGHVYRDRSAPGSIYRNYFRKTDSQVDRKIRAYFDSLVGTKGRWDVIGGQNCRGFSQDTFSHLVDKYGGAPATP